MVKRPSNDPANDVEWYAIPLLLIVQLVAIVLMWRFGRYVP